MEIEQQFPRSTNPAKLFATFNAVYVFLIWNAMSFCCAFRTACLCAWHGLPHFHSHYAYLIVAQNGNNVLILSTNTDVLNVAVARDNEDERHLCPLQLPLIERCLKMWSNPGELVFSPFGGIGSELYEALRWKRRGLGIELKPEYHRVAVRNLTNAESEFGGRTLWDLLPAVEAAGD